MSTTPETPTPDYGEPWKVDSARGVRHESGGVICYPFGSREEEQKMADRIVACVNACAGMTDPANEIQSLREKLRQAEKDFYKITRSVPCGVTWFRLVQAALERRQQVKNPRCNKCGQ